jgi:hypothetical protein
MQGKASMVLKSYRSTGLAAVLVLAACLVAGCKHNEDTGNRASMERAAPVVTDVKGTVECNGQPVTFGYVVFVHRPEPTASMSGPREVFYDWSQISESGSYHCKSAPVGEQVNVMVITDPTAFEKTIDAFESMNRSVAMADKGPRSSTPERGRSGHESQRRGRESDPRWSSMDMPQMSMSPPPGKSMPSSVLEDFRTHRPGSSSEHNIFESKSNGPPTRSDMVAKRGGNALPQMVAKDNVIFNKLPEASREFLAKIGEKYGARMGAIREPVGKDQNELNIKLTVEMSEGSTP